MFMLSVYPDAILISQPRNIITKSTRKFIYVSAMMAKVNINSASGWDEVGMGNANVEYLDDAKGIYAVVVSLRFTIGDDYLTEELGVREYAGRIGLVR